MDKIVHLDDFQSFEHGILDRVGIDHGFLGTLSFGISSSTGWPDNILCLLAFSHIDVHEVFTSSSNTHHACGPLLQGFQHEDELCEVPSSGQQLQLQNNNYSYK